MTERLEGFADDDDHDDKQKTSREVDVRDSVNRPTFYNTGCTIMQLKDVPQSCGGVS
jgi:hypothetical protein